MLNNQNENYDFTAPALKYIGGLTVIDKETRKSYMAEFIKTHGEHEFIDMMVNYIEMVNVVQDNAREMVELFHIAELGVHPHIAEKLNMPTVLGAIDGVKISSRTNEQNLCHGCAFRRGSVANTCLSTMFDVHHCDDNNEIFYCHENMNADGTPSAKCRGYLKSKKGCQK